jgi:hypothetical protein
VARRWIRVVFSRYGRRPRWFETRCFGYWQPATFEPTLRLLRSARCSPTFSTRRACTSSRGSSLPSDRRLLHVGSPAKVGVRRREVLRIDRGQDRHRVRHLTASRAASALGHREIPAPTSPISLCCSSTTTSQPTRSRAEARVRPPIPAPTTAMGSPLTKSVKPPPAGPARTRRGSYSPKRSER